ncbi:transposase zinc-binding domain-containing protein [Desulfitobacterium sp. AusDCA]
MSKLLPVGYFYIVFTLPQELNTLIFQNQKLLYALLLQATGNTFVELAKDPKFLGAATGVTSVLHTWGQNLSFHPHVHCIAPGEDFRKSLEESFFIF